MKFLTKGWGPWRYEWYSICSAHQDFDDQCDCCLTGTWIHCWIHWIASQVHDHCYPLWFWWANRPKFTLRQAVREANKIKMQGG